MQFFLMQNRTFEEFSIYYHVNGVYPCLTKESMGDIISVLKVKDQERKLLIPPGSYILALVSSLFPGRCNALIYISKDTS